MSTKRQGFVALRAGDRALTLRFSMNAICLYEEMAGHNFIDGINQLQADTTRGTLSFTQVRRLLVAGLSDTDNVTPQEAGEIMTELGIEAVVEKLGEAIEAALPARKDAAAGNAAADKG